MKQNDSSITLGLPVLVAFSAGLCAGALLVKHLPEMRPFFVRKLRLFAEKTDRSARRHYRRSVDHLKQQADLRIPDLYAATEHISFDTYENEDM